jgi:hypothetical protein
MTKDSKKSKFFKDTGVIRYKNYTVKKILVKSKKYQIQKRI